jgi:lantibiotic transport system permease protein
MAFWSAVVLPVIICGFIAVGYFFNSHKLINTPGVLQWLRYMGSIMGVMGILILPMFVVFITYSVNNMEHRSEMWKSLFSLPLNKWSIYGSKFAFAVILNALCLALFATFIVGSGYLLGNLKPELKFQDYSITRLAFELHLKLFLSSLGIMSIQFLLSLIWADFIKPMGIGLIGTIAGIISVNTGWKYAFILPYAHPALAIMNNKSREQIPEVTFLTNETYVSSAVAIAAFVIGYFIVSKRSVK